MRTTPIQGDDPSHSKLLRSKPRLRDGPGLHCNGTYRDSPTPCDFSSRYTPIRREPTRCDKPILDDTCPLAPYRADATSLAQARQHWSLTLPVRNIPFHAPATARNATCQNIPERLHQPSCHQAIPTRLARPGPHSPHHLDATINPIVELHIPIQSHVTNRLASCLNLTALTIPT